MSLIDASRTEDAQGEPTTRPTVEFGQWERHAGNAIFAGAAVSAAIWLMLLGRGLTFFYDEWNFIETRGISFWHQVVLPHNGHPSMVPYTIYQILLSTVGLHHYWPYRLVLTVLDLAIGLFLFLLIRTRISPVVAGAAAGVLMLLGPAWQDLLWAFQIGFLGSVAFGLAAMCLVDRNGRRRSDVGAAICLVVSVGCSGVALPFLGGLFAELVWRRQWRRVWIPLAPFLLFVVWYWFEDRAETHAGLPSLGAAVHFYGQAIASSVASLVAGSTDVGTALAIILGVAAAVAIATLPRQSGRLVFAIVGLLAFWTLTVVARTIMLPVASRYLLPGGVFVLIGATEVVALLTARWRRSPQSEPARPPVLRLAGGCALALAAAFAGGVIYWNSSQMLAGADFLAGWSSSVRSVLGAVQFEGKLLPPQFQPLPTLAPQIFVGPYLAAVKAYGSPAVPPSQLAQLPPDEAGLVDQALLGGLALSTRRVTDGDVAPSSCGTMGGSPQHPWLQVQLPQSGLELSADTDMRLNVAARGYGATFVPAGTVTLQAGSRRSLVLVWPGRRPPGLSWTLQLSSAGPYAAGMLRGVNCAAAG